MASMMFDLVNGKTDVTKGTTDTLVFVITNEKSCFANNGSTKMERDTCDALVACQELPRSKRCRLPVIRFNACGTRLSCLGSFGTPTGTFVYHSAMTTQRHSNDAFPSDCRVNETIMILTTPFKLQSEYIALRDNRKIKRMDVVVSLCK